MLLDENKNVQRIFKAVIECIIITLLFGFGIISYWKSYDLLNMPYSIIFSGIILLTGQHHDATNIWSPSRMTPCAMILLSVQLDMNSLNGYRLERFSIIQTLPKT